MTLKFLIHLIFWSVLFLCYFHVIHSAKSGGAKKSVFQKKYTIKTVGVDPSCRQSTKRDASKPVTYTATTKRVNKSLTVIYANYTLLRRIGPMTFSMRIYHVKTPQVKQLVWKSDNINCRNKYLEHVIKIINVKIDTKSCYANAGVYQSEPINLYDFYVVLTFATSGPGRYTYDLEFSNDKGVVFCMAITYDLIENKN